MYSNTSVKQTYTTQTKVALPICPLTHLVRKKVTARGTGHRHQTEVQRYIYMNQQKSMGTHTRQPGCVNPITARRELPTPPHCEGRTDPAGLRLHAATAPASPRPRAPIPSPPRASARPLHLLPPRPEATAGPATAAAPRHRPQSLPRIAAAPERARPPAAEGSGPGIPHGRAAFPRPAAACRRGRRPPP